MISRRRFLECSLWATAPVGLLQAAGPVRAAEPPGSGNATRTLHIVCVGGHPDDPESGCAGTLARYSEQGHRVTVVYLTRGERGIPGKSLEEAAQIRSAECEAACKIMGAKPLFAGQIDGATELNRHWVEVLQSLLAPEAPDILFTHWPVDTHMDHQVASILTIRSYLGLASHPELYLFEVNTGSQSLGFQPNTYVDVTAVLPKKKGALLAHKSQDGDNIWRTHHEPIAKFRGREAGVGAAEAFFHLDRKSAVNKLPGL